MTDLETKVDEVEEVIVDEVVEEVVEETTLSELELLQIEYNKLNDKLLRNAAELENFKRRTNEEKQNFMKFANKNVMQDLVAIVDNFELGLKSLSSVELDSSVLAGVKLIYDQLNNVLTNNGVKEIKCVGEEFDPNFHQAVMTDNNEEFGKNIITEQFQKGYTINDKILRPAMVKVNE